MMIRREWLRAPEGDGPSGAGAAIAAAGEAAIARAATAESTPEPVQSTDPSQSTEPVQQAQTPAEATIEFSYKGRAHKLTKAEADYLLQFGAEAYERAASQMREQPKAEPEKPPLDEIERKVQELVEQRTKPLSEKLETMEREKAMAEIVREADFAMGKHKIFEKFGEDPERGQFLKGVVMYMKGCNPNLSFDAAAAKVATWFEGLVSTEKAAYVQEKISAAGKRVEGSGGSPPAPGPKKLGAKEFSNGSVFEAALERATRAAMER